MVKPWTLALSRCSFVISMMESVYKKVGIASLIMMSSKKKGGQTYTFDKMRMRKVGDQRDVDEIMICALLTGETYRFRLKAILGKKETSHFLYGSAIVKFPEVTIMARHRWSDFTWSQNKIMGRNLKKMSSSNIARFGKKRWHSPAGEISFSLSFPEGKD